jgi:polysaccharide export outer membrane protein
MPKSYSRMTANFHRVMVAAVVLGALALVTRAPAASGEAKPASKLAFYVLRPMDLVKVLVFQEPDMERELRVSQDHTIVMPLIGVVDVRNRTVRDTELLIEDLYRRDYLVNPQVNITVMEYAQRTVNVFGSVNTPGAVLIPPERDFTLLDAIARSGGFSRLANRTRVSLTRTRANGQTENFVINGDQLVSGDSTNRWLVQDGDVIFVPERML